MSDMPPVAKCTANDADLCRIVNVQKHKVEMMTDQWNQAIDDCNEVSKQLMESESMVETLKRELALADETLEKFDHGYHFYSMCQDGHEQIGWKPDEWEECPVCRMRNERDDMDEERKRALDSFLLACDQRDEAEYQCMKADEELERLRAVLAAVAEHDKVFGAHIAAAMKKYDARSE